MKEIEPKRLPTVVEQDFLYQQAKDAAWAAPDEPYNGARAFLWNVKWLDHHAADEIAEKAAARFALVQKQQPE